MSGAALTLGGVLFQDAEVPDQIPFGGDQALKVHKLVGGSRYIDAMGRDDIALAWEGRFFGSDALARAQSINAMRIAGVQVDLTWSELSFSVVIKSFTADYRADFYIPYRISCEIVFDNASPDTGSDTTSIDDQMLSDMDTANTLGGQIGDAATSAGLANLQTAISAVSNFATASRSVIAGVLSPLSTVQATVGTLASSLEGQILGTSSSSVGGVSTGGIGMAATLVAQVNAVQPLPMVSDLANVLGRMNSNLTSVGVTGATVVQGGGSLYQLAAKAYGDSSAWPDIAAANDLTDPVLGGVTTLIVPPAQTDTGGILSP